MYYHIKCPQGVESKYSILVFNDKNEPFMPLTDFYFYQQKRISESSALSYLVSLERFFTWLCRNSNFQGKRVNWYDSHHALRASIEDYLIYELGCKLRSTDDYNFVIKTKKSPQTINHFLAALKAFYRTALHLKSYSFQNPLIDVNYSISIADNNAPSIRIDKPRLPKIAGTETPYQSSYRRQSESYFKLVADEWKPIIIADEDLPYIIYRAGSLLNWSLRDEVIIRMLFETGARINEVLSLTMGDYRRRRNQYEIAAQNKGSENKRIKFLRFSKDTLKLFIRYVNGERKLYSHCKQNFHKLSDNDEIFLTRHGTPYNYNAFYSQWIKITAKANIKINIHKTRHWFVTNMIKSIYEMSKDSSEIEIKKNELINYMKWKSSDTIKVYEHYFSEAAFRDIHETMAKKMNELEKEHLVKTRITKSKREKEEITPVSVEDEWIQELYKGMDD
ncbi:tyrosine-type recombinase/integrase [Paenibacillus sp. 2003]|uniref:tyrosine-type recombinase/integrase n=1 Tax=Paenibacillus sp. 2003 TaxID=2817761 RepID=UPI00286A9BB4|nr:tyrosine-type recombinase/integrase [Paenibacillus sp. 2003]